MYRNKRIAIVLTLMVLFFTGSTETDKKWYETIFTQKQYQYLNLKWKADSLIRTGNPKKGINTYKRVISHTLCYRNDFYKITQYYQKVKRLDSAYNYLMKGINRGFHYNDTSYITKDENLKGLRNSEYWDTLKSLLLKNTIDSTNKNVQYPNIREKLHTLYRIDQNYRIDKIDTNQLARMSISQIDSLTRSRLRPIIDSIGWPTKSKVGYKGQQAAWLVAQHADNDVKFQENCLDKIFSLSGMPRKHLRRNIAYLMDRIAVNRGRKQLFGTQYRIRRPSSDSCHLNFKPIKQREKVNKRRTMMGLSYLKRYKEMSLERFCK